MQKVGICENLGDAGIDRSRRKLRKERERGGKRAESRIDISCLTS
jgi:hypothetical protein